MKTHITAWVLPAIITVLAVADGLLHLRLISLLFGGKYWGTPSFGPPPGAAAAPTGAPTGGGGTPPHALPFITLPNNELFVLNCIGFIVLAALLWVALWRFHRAAWIVDAALVLFSAASIIGWVRVGEPNPSGLGYWSKGLEVALIVALLAHLGASLIRPRVAAAQPRRSQVAA